jgi:putative copper export protein/methionine-rich copper-binding protein CopC
MWQDAARGLVALAALCVAFGRLPGHAPVHGALARSVPAKNARLTEAPRTLRLTFTERPELAFTNLHLLGPDSVEVELGPLRLDSARTVVTDIRGPLVAGTYVVAWQMAGADGHPVRGRYSFSVAANASGLAGSRPATDTLGRTSAPGNRSGPPTGRAPRTTPRAATFDPGAPLSVVIRWLGFTALLAILGVVAFRWAVLGVIQRRGHVERAAAALTQVASTRAASLGAVACMVLAVAALARLVAESYAMHGALEGQLVASMLVATSWGRAWMLQVAMVVVALVGFEVARRGRAAGWAMALIAALALAFTPALSGHAASAPRLTALAIVSDGLHLIGAGGWLGSLLVVVVIGIPAALALQETERGTAVADLVSAFSPTALGFAGLVAVTGVLAAWLHIGSLPALLSSAYGRVLLVKLAILSVAAGTGAFNWLRVRPTLGDLVGTRRIRRSASVELAVGAVVLLVTAILVATPAPMDVTAP